MPKVSFKAIVPTAPMQQQAAPVVTIPPAAPAEPPAVATPRPRGRPRKEQPAPVTVDPAAELAALRARLAQLESAAAPAPVEETQAEQYATELEQDSGQVVEAEVVEEPAPQVTPVVTQTMVRRQSAQLPVRRDSWAAKAWEVSDSQIDSTDVNFPRLNIVQAIGELSQEFPKGALVLNRNTVIFEPQPKSAALLPIHSPVEMIMFAFQPKRWVEKVAGAAGGRLARSEEEVYKMGGVLTFNEAKEQNKPWFQTLATALIFIRRPLWMPETALFGYQAPDGSAWELVQWQMKGGSYTHGARALFSARRTGGLRDSWMAHAWKLSSRFLSYEGGHSAYVPVLQPAWLTPPELQGYLLSVADPENAEDDGL